MIEWLNPGMAWALAGVLAPVIIHFLIRARAKIFPFSAIFFLKETIRKKNQRIRFSQLLLLLCRMALVLFLALALLKPVMKSPPGFWGSLRAETDWVILVDTSLSMRMKKGGESRFSVLKKQFADFLDLLGEKDRVLILTTDGDFVSKVFENVSLEKASLWTKRLAPGFGKSDLLALAQRAEAFLGRSSRVEKAIVLFSDFQASQAGPLLDYLKNKKNAIRTLLVPSGVSVPDKHNLFLSALEIPMISSLEGNRVPVEIKIASKGSGLCRGTLGVLQNGRLIAEVPLSLDDRTEISKTILLERTLDSDTVLEGRLSGDDFPEDNHFHALFRGPPEFSVVEREGGDKNFYVSSALDPFVSQGMEGKTPFKLNPVRSLVEAPLQGTDVVWVSDLLDLSDEDLLRLEEFVHAGGGLLAGFGTLSSAPEYERRLSGAWRKAGGLLPGKLSQVIVKEGKDSDITLSDEKHDALSLLRDPALWAQAKAGKVMRLESPQTLTDPVWLKAGEDPLLLIKPYGKGSVAWFMTSLDAGGTSLVLQGVFVPLLHKVMETLLLSKKPKVFDTVGDRLSFQSDADLKDLSCLDPLGEKCKILADEKGRNAVIAGSPGVYQVFEKERRLKSFAVNAPVEEADMEVLSPEALKSAASSLLFVGAREETLKEFLEKGGGKIPLWRLFLLFVLGCLVAEMFLIWKLRG